MNGSFEHTAGPFLIGSLFPVLAVVSFGLMNEGFSSLRFLLYPGPETWLQLALLGLFAVLVVRSSSALRARLCRAPRHAGGTALVSGLAGFFFASIVLAVAGIAETPWRKFYTYVVAPRAVSAWLLGAILTLASVRARTLRRAAQEANEAADRPQG